MKAKVLSIKNSFEEGCQDDVIHLIGKVGEVIRPFGNSSYLIHFEGEDEDYYWNEEDIQIVI